MSEATQRDTPEVKDYYRTHETKQQIGFDPDGQCLKICRTARRILPGAPSALASALMTPAQFRILNIADLVVGDVMYFDDPHDDNPFGHIVTVMARFKDLDPSSLRSLAVRTNSVKSDMVVPVRADYFGQHWFDGFQFGGRWLNGEPFYDLIEKPKPKPKPKPLPRFKRIEASIKNLEETNETLKEAIAIHQRAGHDRYVRALRRDRRSLATTLANLKAAYNAERRR